MVISVLADAVLASSSGSSDDGSWIPLLFLLSGPVFFMFTYLRYRNTDKRHHHESETSAEIANMQAIDQPVRSVTGVSHGAMSGANHREVRGSGH